jgi:CBS domain containing-hemolysin-like protein
MEPTTQIAIIALCLALSAFFSGSETALLRLHGHEVEREVSGGRSPAAVAIRSLLDSTSRLLVTILLGNNLVNLLGAALASALAIRYLGEEGGVLVATVCMTVLVLLLAEVLPKAFAARYPRRVSSLVALPLYLIHQLLRPVHIAFDRVVEPAVRWIAGGAESEAPGTAEELLRLARSARVDATEATPVSIIGGVGRAVEMHVSDIMVARTEIVAFPVTTPPAELLEHVLEERFTRVPIYEGSIDHVLGLVHLKDLVSAVRTGSADLRALLKPILRVPERKAILGLLADMQRAFVHMAIVKDEFGVTQGLVTQEDILEEIVGEIRDEFDREELLTIRRREDGSYHALGRVLVIDFNRETGWHVPAHRGDTLSGLVFNELGRAPRQGDVVRVPGYEIGVVGVSGTRITEVSVAPRGEPAPADESAEESAA